MRILTQQPSKLGKCVEVPGRINEYPRVTDTNGWCWIPKEHGVRGHTDLITIAICGRGVCEESGD